MCFYNKSGRSRNEIIVDIKLLRLLDSNFQVVHIVLVFEMTSYAIFRVILVKIIVIDNFKINFHKKLANNVDRFRCCIGVYALPVCGNALSVWEFCFDVL